MTSKTQSLVNEFLKSEVFEEYRKALEKEELRRDREMDELKKQMIQVRILLAILLVTSNAPAVLKLLGH